jgi:uncharacterized damage-inducible protein DinB
MDVAELLLDLYGRIPPLVRSAVDGLGPAELVRAPAGGTNPVGWLVWHLTRVEDDHLAEVMGTGQVWSGGDWAGRFGLAAGTTETGWGHRAEQVAAVRPESAAALVEYHEAVDARTRAWLAGLVAGDLDRVVDDRWDPPVTLGVRLVSVADDALQHAGQAGYVRGLLDL